MKIISEPKELNKKICRLINAYKYIRIATAWASMSSAAEELLKNKKKIRKMVVGTQFYQTHPSFIENFIQGKRRRVKFMLPSDGVYHPKAYLFSNSSKEWECLIGSANFTQSALSKNAEVMVHITCKDNDSEGVYNSLVNLIDNYWCNAEEMTEEIYQNYRKKWEVNQKKIKSLSGNYNSKKSTPLLKSRLSCYSWDEYYQIIQKDELHSFDRRIELLGIARGYFHESGSFNRMSKLQRKQIAGTTNQDDWGWFGGNSGQTFQRQINDNNQYLSSALDFIPLETLVTRENYLSYIDEFLKAFPNGYDGIATASRLLAMKRPDTFICLNDANKKQLAEEFDVTLPSFSSKNKQYERYWDEVIERIQDCVWWQSPQPIEQREARAWQGRVAMLDAITMRNIWGN